MRPFEYRRAGSMAEALALAANADTAILAGGTELVPWLVAGIAAPSVVVDISRIGAGSIAADGGQLRIGALTRMAEIAVSPLVLTEAPALAAAVATAASPAIRAAGTIAGNLLQRTRCPYFRSTGPCNQREPGSGCQARVGDHRHAAVFGLSERCVAAHPSDLAVVLANLDAIAVVASAGGSRPVPVGDLYPQTAGEPFRLARGELITEIVVPTGPASRRTLYRKVRERAAFDFALITVAATCLEERGVVAEARLTVGSVGPGPRRCLAAEARLVGVPLERAAVESAVEAELALATPLPGAAFKVELIRRLAADLLLEAGGAR